MSGAYGPERVSGQGIAPENLPGEWAEAENVLTLREAHILAWRLRPRPGATDAAQLLFHRRAATLYRLVADKDAAHQHESLACATVEDNHAEKLTKTERE
ncbi:hypothetical protein GCM10022243_47550 [Saccharothrix violaceirubra]|uniref:Uncharacterized protein n=1 Tax=Saccharothrix violaceirubra TaxID=413306 RepID=A0A7W7T6K0_9PSEU|nr:AMED_5909 family protein [Saccharothrix violaceirubra]MBB4967506.1 hypothetical protein [Saccharothrix violaceirubra]